LATARPGIFPIRKDRRVLAPAPCRFLPLGKKLSAEKGALLEARSDPSRVGNGTFIDFEYFEYCAFVQIAS
jgi:hypothetical protein